MFRQQLPLDWLLREPSPPPPFPHQQLQNDYCSYPTPPQHSAYGPLRRSRGYLSAPQSGVVTVNNGVRANTESTSSGQLRLRPSQAFSEKAQRISGPVRTNYPAMNNGTLALRPSLRHGASDRRAWHKGELDAVWEKAQPIPGMDANHRADAHGNMIFKPSVGKDTLQGWTADHGKPLSRGGTYHSNNLHPMQYAQNRHKGAQTTTQYKASNPEPMGITVPEYNAQHHSGVDLRSSAVRSGDLSFKQDGSVDRRCSAVRSHDVLTTKSGHVDGRSAAVKRGDVKQKNSD